MRMKRRERRNGHQRSASHGVKNFQSPRLTCHLGMLLPSHHLLDKANMVYSKRAKTEDEKEQRRIERVLRNRAAAQSSRERKRQEVEKLEGEKATIEQHNQYLKDRLMAAEHEKFLLSQQVKRMEAQMKAMKAGSSIDMSDNRSPEPEAKPFDERKIKQEIDDYATSLLSPESYSSPSSMTYSASQSPSQPSLIFDEESLATSPDMTQHPAAMLCDLQCQSGEARSSAPIIMTTTTKPVTPSSLANRVWKGMALTSAAYSQLMTPFHAILSTISSNHRRISSLFPP